MKVSDSPPSSAAVDCAKRISDEVIGYRAFDIDAAASLIQSALDKRDAEYRALAEKWLAEAATWEFPAVRGIFKQLARELKSLANPALKGE